MAEVHGHGSRGTLPGGLLFAGRYRIERMLGRGGTATVYRAEDQQTDAEVALKHLRGDAGAAQCALFQREYHTLAQIAHPHVIRAFDYGVTRDGPYYTMELLDGRDLSEVAPLPWPEACRVLRDVASALAILHSRRLLHRDVSHRNVRLTSDGCAKLIDFGAMTPMGFAPDVIGTPPFLSPEAADCELLDQRTDLYALGALAYWLLCGSHLYPAKSVRALRDLWAESAAPVPAFPADVPAALQRLVMALMQRDAGARPGSAAEVIDRLAAIAGLPAGDDSSIARSYLTNPKLIGRAGALDVLKRGLERALSSRRGVLQVIAGPHGTGRSRLLQETVLQAKFAGFTVLQASAQASARAPYAVLGRLMEDLARKLPEAAAEPWRARRMVAQAAPGQASSGGASGAASDVPPQELAARKKAALTAHLLEVSERVPLLLAVDDVDLSDEASLAVLVALSRRSEGGPSLLVTMVDTDPKAGAAARLLAPRAKRTVALRAFDGSEIERLVESLFGNSPNTQRVARWMQEHTAGNPLECMELARHLVDRRAAQYLDGAWILPAELPAGVPRGLAEAFRVRVEALEPRERALAEVLALYGKPAPLSLCIELSGSTADAEVFQALERLVGAELLVARRDEYAIPREGLRDALLSGLPPARRAELHQRIGEALLARGAADRAAKLEAGHHLLRSPAPLRGLALIEEAMRHDRQAPLVQLGEAVVPALELALAVAEAHEVAPVRCMRLRSRLTQCAFFYDKRLIGYAEPLLDRLAQDCGLTLWLELGPERGSARLARALAAAQERYDRTPEEQRGLAPIEALIELGNVVGSALGVAIFGYDVATIARLARIVAPLEELEKASPMAMIYDLVTAIHEFTRGRLRTGQTLRQQLVDRLRDPAAYRGLSDEHRKTILATQLHALGMRAASEHSGRAFALADEIDALDMAMYHGAALQIRMLAELYRCDADAARAWELRLDAAWLQGGAGKQTEIWSFGYLVGAYALWGDVLALKRTTERLAALVEQHPGHLPHFYVALGAYYRERGQLEQSKTALLRALRASEGRMHPQWAMAMCQYIETLVAASELEEAVRLAREHFGERPDDEQERASYMEQLLPVVALAEARLGKVAAAALELERGIARAEAEERPLAFRARLHEARARVAIEARDAAAFEHHAGCVGELYRSANNSVLLLKHLALLDAGARAGLVRPESLAERRRPLDAAISAPTVQDRPPITLPALTQTVGERERWALALALLCDECGAAGGVLLSVRDGARVLSASPGEALPSELTELARALGEATTTASRSTRAGSEAWSAPDGQRYQLVSLVGSSALVGVAALRVPGEAPLQRPSSALLSAVARVIEESEELGTPRPIESWL